MMFDDLLAKVIDFYEYNNHGVVEIVGATASGKTGLSVKLAKALLETGKKVEIISVDSRQVYRDCDISSAKITVEEMEGIPHHGIDIVDLDEEYSVYDWQQYAFKTIKEIHERGNLVMLAGGTMMWLDAVSENYDFDVKGTKSDRRKKPLWDFMKVGIHWSREELYQRINNRAVDHFENGLIEETQRILRKYPDITKNAFTSFGYQEIQKYLKGEISYEEALASNQQRNRNYAKKQLTWWRGRDDIIWVEGKSLA